MNSLGRFHKLFIALAVALFLAASLWPWKWNTSDQRRSSLKNTGAGQLAGQQGSQRPVSGVKDTRETKPRKRNARVTNERRAQRQSTTLLPELALPSTRMEIAALSELTSPTVSPAEGLSTSRVVEREIESLDAKEARPDQPDEALRFRLLQMQDENRNIPADALLKAKAQVNVMTAVQAERARAAGKTKGIEVASLQPSDWTWLGPGNVGGRIRAVVIDPNNANNMWVGSVGGGIWRSTNAGGSWVAGRRLHGESGCLDAGD